MCDFTDETLEGELSDQELGGLLVTADLTEGDGSWLISVWLLDTTGRWCGLAGSLGCELLTRGLATSGLTYRDNVSVGLRRVELCDALL